MSDFHSGLLGEQPLPCLALCLQCPSKKTWFSSLTNNQEAKKQSVLDLAGVRSIVKVQVPFVTSQSPVGHTFPEKWCKQKKKEVKK